MVPPLSLPGIAGCWFHHLTGLHCPGCGGTRAIIALLYGDWEAAIGQNLFLAAFVPVVVIWLAWWAVQRIGNRDACVPRIPAPAAVFALGVALTFTILRNLPFAPFNSLAP